MPFAQNTPKSDSLFTEVSTGWGSSGKSHPFGMGNRPDLFILIRHPLRMLSAPPGRRRASPGGRRSDGKRVSSGRPLPRMPHSQLSLKKKMGRRKVPFSAAEGLLGAGGAQKNAPDSGPLASAISIPHEEHPKPPPSPGKFWVLLPLQAATPPCRVRGHSVLGKRHQSSSLNQTSGLYPAVSPPAR